MSAEPQRSGALAQNLYPSAGFSTASAGYDPATFDQRAIAWTIDTLLLLAVQQGVEIVAGSVSGLTGLLTILYFSVGHTYFECTAGKYFVGLRVHLVGDESKKIFRIIFRETIGRTLSILFLGFGYLAMFFSRDRATWHDRLSGTQVVSLSPVTGSTLGMFLRALGSLALLVVGILAYVLGTALYSTAPLRALESRLALGGVHITGIRGNMMNGFEIDKLVYEKDQNLIELNSIRVRLDPWASLELEKEFRLKHLTVESGLVRLAPVETKRAKGPPPEKAKVAAEPAKKSENVKLSIEQVDFSAIVFEGFGQKFDLSRFFVSNVTLTTLPATFGMDRFYVDSSKFFIDVPRVEYSSERIDMAKPMIGKIKASGFPERLKMDLSFSARYWGVGPSKSLEAQLFNSQFSIGKKGEQYSLAVKQWSPANYFKGHYPISQITLQILGERLTNAEVFGDYFLRNKKFAVHKQNLTKALVALAGEEVTTVPGAKPTTILLSPAVHKSDGRAWFKLGNGLGPGDDAESLALLYFQRTFEQLTPPEKAIVESDITFFRTSLWKR